MEMSVTDFSASGEDATTPTLPEAGAQPAEAPKRGRGRPKGSGARKIAPLAPLPADLIPSEFRDPKVERWLQDHHVDFTLIWLDLDKLNRADSLRNQARHQALNQETVERYEAAMRAGSTFPPIVVFERNGSYIVIDGNHRVAAYDLNKVNIVSAYLVHGPSAAQVLTLTYEANTKHGRPTSHDERLTQAVDLMARGSSLDEAAMLLSLNPNALKYYVDRKRADERLLGLGFTRLDRIPPSVRVRLSAIRSDVVLNAATQLALDGALRGEEIASLVTAVNKTRSSEKAQLALIEQERESRKGAIKVTAGGRVPVPQQVTTYFRATSLLTRLNQKGLTEALRNMPPELRGDVARAATAAVDVLMAVSRDVRLLRDE